MDTRVSLVMLLEINTAPGSILPSSPTTVKNVTGALRVLVFFFGEYKRVGSTKGTERRP
jgi:hypothetical protein